MLTMFTAMEAKATALLLTPQDYSLYQHIEIRINDAVQNGGMFIIYAGEMTDSVLAAYRALGYRIAIGEVDGKNFYRISWEDV